MSAASFRLSNGLYVYSSKTVKLSEYRQLAVEALIPVMRKYFVETENLKKEFVAFLKQANRWRSVSTVTDYPVKSLKGNMLFYLQKTTSGRTKSKAGGQS